VIVKRVLVLVLGFLIVIGGGGWFVLMKTTAGQDFVLSRAVAAMAAAEAPVDGIRVFVCGSAAPLPTEGRAQACLAILTPSHYFIVDAGPGSANTINLGGLPGARLDRLISLPGWRGGSVR
jgi:ribonuclease Z